MRLNDPDLLRQHCLVGGRWVGTPEQSVVNPASGAMIAKVPKLTRADIEHAVEMAAAALATWSKLSARDRARVLDRWAALVRDNAADLACLICAEQGKPMSEAQAEVASAAAFLEYYAEEGKRVYGEVVPPHRQDARTFVIRQPVGVCAAITPWNFPAAIVARKIAPALAVGCPVLLKPAPETPLTALALGVLAERAGLPRGTLNILTGDAVEIGEVLTRSPPVRALSFTGSTRVGKLLMAQCAVTVKRVSLELGGNAPFIVFDDADLEAAVEGAMAAKFRNMGQTCVSANRFYVQKGIYSAFVTRFEAAIAKLSVGVDSQQGPLIRRSAVEKAEAHVRDAVEKGARIVVGGARHSLGSTFFQPTLLTGVDATMIITREETFGPVAAVIEFESEDEVVRLANATEYGLAAYAFTRDSARVLRLSEALEAGMVGINVGAIGTEVAPFGGIKQSGIGREGSRHGLEEFLEIKYVLVGGLSSTM